MDTIERAAVRRAMDELKPFLAAYLTQRGIEVPPTGPAMPRTGGGDMQALLKACLSAWEQTLRRELPNVAKSYIHELVDIRNRWAHEEPFTRAEADRAADTARQLGSLIGAPASARATRTAAESEATRPEAPRAAHTSVRRETQRDVMSRIFVSCGRDHQRAIREYAAAERSGEVRRKSNKHGISAEDYARALIADGLKKGWL